MRASTKPRGLWFQFSLRALFVTMLLAGAGLAWLAAEVKWVHRRTAAVNAMAQTPGTEVIVCYKHEVDPKGQVLSGAKRPGPDWIARLLGDEFLTTISSVSIHGPGGKQALNYLDELGDIEHLSVSLSDQGTRKQFVSNRDVLPSDRAGFWSSDELRQLSQFSNLRTLDLADVTLAHPGVKHFKRLERLETLRLGRARLYRTAIKGWQQELPD